MGDGGLAGVTGEGGARKGNNEEKRVERAVEEDMEGLFGTEEYISGGVAAAGTCRKVL